MRSPALVNVHGASWTHWAGVPPNAVISYVSCHSYNQSISAFLTKHCCQNWKTHIHLSWRASSQPLFLIQAQTEKSTDCCHSPQYQMWIQFSRNHCNSAIYTTAKEIQIAFNCIETTQPFLSTSVILVHMNNYKAHLYHH